MNNTHIEWAITVEAVDGTNCHWGSDIKTFLITIKDQEDLDNFCNILMLEDLTIYDELDEEWFIDALLKLDEDILHVSFNKTTIVCCHE